ncbi:MAG: hypothetical protein ACOC7K_01425, partial [bacterium]
SQRTILRRARRRADWMKRLIAEHDSYIVKETRFCLTLPAWLDAGAHVERLVICLRHPHAVARSLRRRNRAPLPLGVRLWREHNERLLTAVGPIPVWYVDYERLLDAGRGPLEFAGLLRFMGLEVPEQQQTVLHRDVVQTKLNHYHAVEEVVRESAARRLWEKLQERIECQQAASCETT